MFVEPIHEGEDVACESGEETECQEDLTQNWMTRVAIINDGSNTCADQPVEL